VDCLLLSKFIEFQFITLIQFIKFQIFKFKQFQLFKQYLQIFFRKQCLQLLTL